MKNCSCILTILVAGIQGMEELCMERMKRSRVPVGVIRMDYILQGRYGTDNGELLGCDGTLVGWRDDKCSNSLP